MKVEKYTANRESHNIVNNLMNKKAPITLPQARIMGKAIKDLQDISTAANINFLLSVAEQNHYGVRHNSALRKFLEEESSISGKKLEHNDWDNALKSAITETLKKLPQNRRETFIEDFNRVFIQERPYTDDEKSILNFRKGILNSPQYKAVLEAPGKKQLANDIIKNMDYFIASSETSMEEKIYVLSKLNYMLSDDYEINPQLKDKKIKLLSEILNDLVVNAVENKIPNIKAINQKQHGSCGAISAARKYLAYEDKTAYIDLVLSEVDANPYMDIYDVTKLFENNPELKNPEGNNGLRAPKIRVNKTSVNYDKALAEGYRIVDASVLNWLKIAGTVGDGTLELQDYYAFDARHKGFMHDTRIIKSADDSYADVHNLLRVLIKSRNILKSYELAIHKDKAREQVLLKNKNTDGKALSALEKRLESILADAIPGQDKKLYAKAIQKMPKSEKINFRNRTEILNKELLSYFADFFGKNIDEISFSKDFNSLALKYNKLYKLVNAYNRYKKPDAKAEKAKKIFMMGVAERETVEAQLNLPGVNDIFYDDLKLPNRAEQIKNEVKKLSQLAVKKPDSPKIKTLMEKYGADKVEICQKLSELDNILSHDLAKELDLALSEIGLSYKMTLVNYLQERIMQLNEGDYSYMYNLSERLNFVPNVEKFKNKLYKIVLQIQNTNDYESMNKAFSELGSTNPYFLVQAKANQLAEKVSSEISEDEILQNPIGGGFQPNQQKEFLQKVLDNVVKINNICEFIEQAADIIDMPSEKEVILKAYEKKGDIPTEEELISLRKKFDEIKLYWTGYSAAGSVKNEYGKLPDIFLFNRAQTDTLKKIQKSIPQFKRTLKREYIRVNREIKTQLEDLYKTVGMRKGQFWIGEEGYHGLLDSEILRIMEQMTGRAYHIEKSFEDAVNFIKSGKGSGISSSHVDYNDFSGHSQYIADIRPMKVFNPKQKEYSIKDVLLHDNTWGAVEYKKSWVDEMGLPRTDYNIGLGGPRGFVTNHLLQNGDLVDELKYAKIKVLENEKPKPIDGPESEIYDEKTEYPVMNATILPGIDTKSHRRIKKIFDSLFAAISIEQKIDNLLGAVIDNKINIKKIDKFDDYANSKFSSILERINGKNSLKKLSIQEFNKLPDDDPLKVIINLVILKKAIKNYPHNEYEGDLKSMADIDKYKNQVIKYYKEDFNSVLVPNIGKEYIEDFKNTSLPILTEFIEKIERTENIDLKYFKDDIEQIYDIDMLKKNFDGSAETLINNMVIELNGIITDEAKDSPQLEKYRDEFEDKVIDEMVDFVYPKNIEDIKKLYFGEELISFIDKKFNPMSDNELKKIFNKLLNKPAKYIDELLKEITFEDLGIKFDTPENVIKLIQAGNSLETKRLSDEARGYYYYEYFPAKPSKDITQNEIQMSTLYRVISTKLSGLNTEKLLREYRETAFTKYGARPALPNIKVYSDSEILNIFSQSLDNLAVCVNEYTGYDKMLKYSSVLQKLTNILSDKIKFYSNKEILSIVEQLQALINNEEDAQDSVKVLEIMRKDLEINALTPEKAGMYKEILLKNFREIVREVDIVNLPKLRKEARTKVLENVEFLVKTQISPKFQDKFRAKINIWLQSIIKMKDNAVIKEETQKLLDASLKMNIYEKPSDILSYAVKTTQKSPKAANKELHSEIVLSLSEALKAASKKAYIADLEFELMKSASLGIAAKTMNLYGEMMSLKLSNGEQVSLLSNKGLLSLIKYLCDSSNNHNTLVLFFEQTGLVDKLISVLTQTTPEKYTDIAIKHLTAIKDAINVKDEIENNYRLFLDTLSETQKSEYINKKNLADISKLYIKSQKLPKEISDSNSLLSLYIKQFNSIKDTLGIPEKTTVIDTLSALHETSMQFVMSKVEETVGDMNNDRKLLSFYMDIYKSLRLAADSEDDKFRTNFLNEIYDVMDDEAAAVNRLNEENKKKAQAMAGLYKA